MKAAFRALRVRNYRLWVMGSVVSNIGTWMQRVAQDWLVLTVLTEHSGTAVGIATALQFLPILFLGPYAGVLADRYSKRTMLLWTQTAMGLSAAVLGVLVVTGSVQLWQVFAASLALGVASAFDVTARQAFVSEVVGPDDVANAVALNSASFNLGRLGGPGIAGLLIAWIGTGPVFLLNAGTFVAVLLSLFRMRTGELFPTQRSPRGKRQISEGFRYVRQSPDLMLAIILTGVVGTFGMNFQITNALMATAVFGQGPEAYGLLGSVMAVGTLAGALLAAARQGPRMRFLLGGAFGLGIFSVGASVMPNYWLYAVWLVFVGLALMTFMNSSLTMIQVSSEPQFRGRVLSLYLAVMQGGTALGGPLVGWIATQFGGRSAVAVSGILVLVAAIWALILVSRRSGRTMRERVATGWKNKRTKPDRQVLTKSP
jgi:MFS family permease